MQKVKAVLIATVGIGLVIAVLVVGTVVESGFTVAKVRSWQWLFG